MARTDALQELQTRLAERLQQVRSEPTRRSWLAVDCGGQGVLFPLQEAGEIFNASTVVPVPHTQPWFGGVVNLRGGVCTVVDLAAFLGLRERCPVDRPAASWLVAFNATLGVNGALLVDRLEGLRHAGDMSAEVMDEQAQALAGRSGFAIGRWHDEHGRSWQEISLAGLARQAQFLAITG